MTKEERDERFKLQKRKNSDTKRKEDKENDAFYSDTLEKIFEA